jgi:hypothetical protein
MEMSKDKEQIEYLQKLLDSTMEMWAAMVGSIIAGVVEKYGEGAKKVVSKAVYDACKWETEKTAKELGVSQKGTKILAKYGYPAKGSRVGDVGVYDLEHAKLEDKRFDLKVNFCPYAKTWKDLGIIDRVPDLCDMLTEGDNGVSVVFAPDLRMTLTKCITKGDPYCIYSWREIKKKSKKKQ